MRQAQEGRKKGADRERDGGRGRDRERSGEDLRCGPHGGEGRRNDLWRGCTWLSGHCRQGADVKVFSGGRPQVLEVLVLRHDMSAMNYVAARARVCVYTCSYVCIRYCCFCSLLLQLKDKFLCYSQTIKNLYLYLYLCDLEMEIRDV